MLRDFTQATYDELMAEIDTILYDIYEEAVDQGIIQGTSRGSNTVVSVEELERLAGEMGIDVDLGDEAYQDWAFYIRQLEEEAQRQKQLLPKIWQDVHDIGAHYAFEFEKLEAESAIYRDKTIELISLFDPAKGYFEKNPAQFAAMCSGIGNGIEDAVNKAIVDAEVRRMGSNGNYNWDYIEQLMQDENATEAQKAALLIVYLGMESTADMERFIDSGYVYHVDENGVETLRQTNTFRDVIAAAGQVLVQLAAVLDNENISPADYDAATLSDQMAKLGILVVVGANHPSIDVPHGWQTDDDVANNPTGLPGGNGVPVRITRNPDGSYTIACAREYPYDDDMQKYLEDKNGAFPEGQNTYYHITGVLNDGQIVVTQTDSVASVLGMVNPDTNGGKAAFTTVAGYVLGEIIDKAFSKPGGMVWAAIEGAGDWVNDLQLSNTITSVIDFSKFTDSVYLLGGDIQYVMDEKGNFTILYLGFGSANAFFRIQGFIDANPSVDKDTLINAVLAGEQPLYGEFKNFIFSGGYQFFERKLYTRFERLEENSGLSEEEVAMKFANLSVSQLTDLLSM